MFGPCLRTGFLLLAMAAAVPGAAWGHAGAPDADAAAWTRWSADPLVMVPLALTVLLFARGVARLWRRAGVGRGVPAGRVLAFAAAVVALAAGLLSPVDAAAGDLVSAHMAQHMLLMAVAAPLFVAAAPLPPLLAGLPAGWGRRLARRWNTAGALPALWSWLTRPLVAFLLQAAAIWVWHAPAPYQAALGDGVVHDAEHLTFLGTALLFWWSAMHGRGTPAGRALGVLAVFGTLLHTGLLGALMTFAPNPWYPAYGAAPLAWGLTPLEDQQLAGLVMWVPGGLLYLGAGLLLLGRRILRAGPAPARPIPPAAGRGRAGWRSPPPACG